MLKPIGLSGLIRNHPRGRIFLPNMIMAYHCSPLKSNDKPWWRAMVDRIMIDTAYNGEGSNIVIADIPEKKTVLVNWKYQLPIPEGQTTIAVKITDMLGEEVLVT